MLQELSQDNLSEIVTGNKTVIVQYSAGWCGNCRIMKPGESISPTNIVYLPDLMPGPKSDIP